MGRFWSWCFLTVAMLGFVATLAGISREASWVALSQSTSAEVLSIASRTEKSRRRANHHITRFSALIRYSVAFRPAHYEAWIDAGSSRGRAMPASESSLYVGQSVEILYAPENPTDIVRNDFLSIWLGYVASLLICTGALALCWKAVYSPPRRPSRRRAGILDPRHQGNKSHDPP